MRPFKQHFSNVGIAVTLIVFGQLFSSPAEAKIYKGTVTKVSDGDTIRFMPDGAAADEKAWSIRMMTMDTAELHLPAPGGVYSQGYWAEEGKYALQKLISVGDRVEIDHFGMDSYGRVLGKIYKGEMEVNFEMIRSGWAALYVICDEKSCDLDPAYRTACRKAVNSGSGLFNPANPVPELPFLYRSRIQRRPLAKFVGNFRTKKYYAPEDYNRVDICDRVFFMTESDAKAKGFRPAF